ncbi:MAG TPA: 30S ribosomal protein S9 [Bacteroidota bacterium]|nr:30S ribosomal protein S9 [Bacteroidota bacterium]
MHPIVNVGRRKTAVARVKLIEGSGKVLINGKPLDEFFRVETLRQEVLKPFEVTQTAGRYDAHVRVEGGGTTGQAGAIKLGIARSLVNIDEEFRVMLRNHGLLTRDPRMVERKKYGQKKARKRFQFSKR